VATIRDVAASAGVAPSTVSNILSGKKKFPAATVDRVMASISELGYRPDPAARALALGRTNIIGFLASVLTDLPGPDVDVFMRFVRAAVYTARQRGFDVLLMGKGQEELEGDMLVDALVVMDIRNEDPRLPLLRSRGLPTVLVGMPRDPHGMSAFDLDFREAARLSVRHLVELGHREIACLATPDQPAGLDFAFQARFSEGFAEESAAQGIRAHYIPGGNTVESVERWARQVATDPPGVTGIVVLNVGVLDVLLNRIAAAGGTVPGTMSVIAITSAEELARSFPGISVVDIPGRRMVELAVNRALDELAGAPSGVQQLLPAVLVDRGSTGPAAANPTPL
jgi:DNA-binding LacI/PurR family transcriptional regulator